MILTLKGSDQIRLFMILFHFMACVNYPFDLDNFFFFSMTFYFQILTRLFISFCTVDFDAYHILYLLKGNLKTEK